MIRVTWMFIVAFSFVGTSYCSGMIANMFPEQIRIFGDRRSLTLLVTHITVCSCYEMKILHYLCFIDKWFCLHILSLSFAHVFTHQTCTLGPWTDLRFWKRMWKLLDLCVRIVYRLSCILDRYPWHLINMWNNISRLDCSTVRISNICRT